MSFKRWKIEKDFEDIQGKYTESGQNVDDKFNNSDASPYHERIQESDDPAADIDVEDPDWFQNLIAWRRKDKRNTSIFVLGAPRAGKSYTALTLGEVTDANGDFDVENHVVMHTADFVRKINEFPEGCNIVYDEGGAGHSSRRFMSKMNIMMNAVLQTFGSRYINVVWTVPNMRMEDVTARQLCTFSIRMIARGKGIVYSHWSDVHTAKPFYKRLGAYVKFDKPFQDKPRQIKLYEKMKREYQTIMYEGIARELDQMDREEKDMTKLKDPNYLTEEIRKNLDDFLTDRGNINVWAVKAAFQGAPMTSVYTAKELLKQKYGIGTRVGIPNLKTAVQSPNGQPSPSFSAPAYSPPGAQIQKEPDGSVGLHTDYPVELDDSPQPLDFGQKYNLPVEERFQVEDQIDGLNQDQIDSLNLDDEVKLQASPETSSPARVSPFDPILPGESRSPQDRQKKPNDGSEIVLE